MTGSTVPLHVARLPTGNGCPGADPLPLALRLHTVQSSPRPAEPPLGPRTKKTGEPARPRARQPEPEGQSPAAEVSAGALEVVVLILGNIRGRPIMPGRHGSEKALQE
jgi:hypothetical protein